MSYPGQDKSTNTATIANPGTIHPNRIYWVVGSVILLLWVGYFLQVFFDIDLIGFLSHQDHETTKNSSGAYSTLVSAIIVTVIGVPLSIIKANKLHGLAARGVRIQGTVVSKSLLRRGGQAPTTIAYTVNGKEYKFRKDLRSKDYAVGDVVEILYDPAKPKVCEIVRRKPS